MRSKQQPRPSFRWPQQRGDNLTGKYPNHTQRISTHERARTRTRIHLTCTYFLARVSCATTRCASFPASTRFSYRPRSETCCVNFYLHANRIAVSRSTFSKILAIARTRREQKEKPEGMGRLVTAKISQVSSTCALYVCVCISVEKLEMPGEIYCPVARVNNARG